MKKQKDSYCGYIPSADPIVKHIYSGVTKKVDAPKDPPESFLKSTSNTGGQVPMSRVYNEVK